ncbi:MAG: Crp/Fnr family transcriptional regulator [Rubrivivax sp.]
MITDRSIERPAADVLAAALAGLPAATAAALRHIGHGRRWRAGAVVLRAGEVSPAALLLLDGRLRLSAASPLGHAMLFRWVQPGEFIGLVSVLGHVPAPTDAVADGPVQALVFTRQDLLAHLRTDADGALHFAALASRHAAHLAELLVQVHAGTLQERIVGVLSRMAGLQPAREPAREVRLRLSHRDIAQAVGASRQRVSVELSKLQAKGVLRLGYRQVLLTAPAARG